MAADADDPLLRRLAGLSPERRAMLEALLDAPAPPEAMAPAAAAGARELTPVEQTLRTIWEQVLGISGIGPEDDFFEIGGDSIAAMRVAARAQKAGLTLTVRDLLAHPTIVASAATISASLASRPHTASRAPAAVHPLPLTPGQWPLLAAGSGGRGVAAHRLTMRATRTPGRVMTGVLDTIVRRHGALRLRLQQGSAGWELLEEPRPAPASLLDLRALSDDAGERVLARVERQLGATIGEPDRSLVRSIAWQTRDEAGLTLAGHRCSLDRESLEILRQEIVQLLPALTAGRPAGLPTASRFSEWMMAQPTAFRQGVGRTHPLRGTITRDMMLPRGWPPAADSGSLTAIERWTLTALAGSLRLDTPETIVSLAVNGRSGPPRAHAVGCYAQPSRFVLSRDPLIVRLAREVETAQPDAIGITCAVLSPPAASSQISIADAPRWASYALAIDNVVESGRWQTTWRFDEAVHSRAAMQEQCERFVAELARAAGTPGLEPVPIGEAFAEAELTTAEMDRLFAS